MSILNTMYNVIHVIIISFWGIWAGVFLGGGVQQKTNNLTIYHITVNTVSTPSEHVLIIDEMDI